MGREPSTQETKFSPKLDVIGGKIYPIVPTMSKEECITNINGYMFWGCSDPPPTKGIS